MKAMKPPEEKHTVITIDFQDSDAFMALASAQDENFKALQKQANVQMRVRGNQVTIQGAKTQVDLAVRVLQGLYKVVQAGRHLGPNQVTQTVIEAEKHPDFSIEKAFLQGIVVRKGNFAITPRTPGQSAYLEAMRTHDIVFAVGPAGTGKTFLAMAAAINALMEKAVKRIILSRPAVEAGERLGFLPGDMQEKVDPYLRPLYDALHDTVGVDKAMELMQNGSIEVAPLAFMRGRTLNNAFVILDEAQNTSIEQMKMFLTRLGYNSRAVITGDITQIDIPEKGRSGLVIATRILEDTEGIAVCRLTKRDVIRHPLVQKVIAAYEKYEAAQAKGKDAEPPESTKDR